MGRPIAITGAAALASVGTTEAVEAALRAGRDGLALHPGERLPLAAHLPVGAVTTPLPPHLPRTVALARHVGQEALAQAGLPAGAVGLILGSCTGGMAEGEAAYLAGAAPGHRAYGRQPVGRSVVLLARHLGIAGPRSAHAEACASAAAAMAEAMGWIRAGLVPAVLVIGADALCRLTMAGFHSLQVVDPAGCRPLTEERAGMNLGEGACALVLEDAHHARQRGATVLGSLLGWGLSADGHHATAPDPAGTHLTAAITSALTDAGVAPKSIGFAAIHGTATRDNDAQETAVLGRLFGPLPAASHKRTTGHTLGAAAAFGTFAALTALRRQELLPSAGLHGTPLTAVTPVAQRQAARMETALVTCLAFGGVNGALVLGTEDQCA